MSETAAQVRYVNDLATGPIEISSLDCILLNFIKFKKAKKVNGDIE